jgi:hypothetical protein
LGNIAKREKEEVMRIAHIARIVFGIVLLAGSATNAFLALTQPEVYTSFADTAILPLYRDLWGSLVVPYLRFWLLLVVAFELTTGILILSKRVWVKVGLVGAILFFLFLVPFWWEGGALINIAFAVIVALLLRYDYDASIIDLIRKRSAAESA